VGRQGGKPPTAVVLTHPARWGRAQLERLGDAAARAGIGNPVFMAEPVAAAWWYARPTAGQLLAVFDLGGGTLDTAVLRASQAGFEIAGPPGGDADLGGEDFDELLLGHVAAMARNRDPAAWAEVSAADRRARSEMARLRADVTVAKEALTEYLAYDLVVPGFAEAFAVTRADLAELIAAAVERAVAEMRATIAAAGAGEPDRPGLYLTGGSSRIPLIAARLAVGLGVEPQLRDDPKGAVALGALAAAAAASADGAAQALMREAEQLEVAGNTDGAISAYRRVMATGQPDQSPAAAVTLGALLVERGDQAGARVAFQAAIDSGNARNAPVASYNLGNLLIQQGDVAGARAAYQFAMDRGDPETATGAAHNLAIWLYERGDAASAIPLWRRVIDSGHPTMEPQAAYLLGTVLLERGDMAGARSALQRAVDSGEPEAAPGAAVNLGMLLMNQGDAAGARRAWEQAVRSADPEAAAQAAVSLGTLLINQGDAAGARRAWEQAARSDYPEMAAIAVGNLRILAQRGG
jgi:tetratricopeptide (TPR) repeat protein